MTAQKMTVQDWQFEGDHYISIDGGMSINLNSKDGLWLVKNLLGLKAQSERGASQSEKIDAAHEDARQARVEPLAVSEEAYRHAENWKDDDEYMAVQVMARELLRLHEALPQVVRDAERYRWLRNYVGPGDIQFFRSGASAASLESISAEVDTAIDAALKGGSR